MLTWRDLIKILPQGSSMFATGAIILLLVAYGVGRLHGAESHAASIAKIEAELSSVTAINQQFKSDIDTQRKATALLAEEAIKRTNELGKVSAELEKKRTDFRAAFNKQMTAIKATGNLAEDAVITANILRSATKGDNK